MTKRWSIGVGLPRWRDATARVYEGILTAGHRLNCEVQYLGYYDQDHLVQRVGAMRVDGLAIYVSQAIGEQVKQAIDPALPVVSLVMELQHLGWPCLTVDLAGAVHTAVRHLRQTGYRQLAYLGFGAWRTSEMCERTFTDLAGPEGHLWRTSCRLGPTERERDEPAVIEELAAWLKSVPLPVGVLAYDEFLAACAARACAQADIAVPDRAGVISLADDLQCACARPPISAVQMPLRQIGDQTVVMLDDLRHGRAVASRVLPVNGVLARSSTGMADDDALHLADALQFIQDHGCGGATVDDVLGHLQMVSRTKLYELFEQRVGRSPAAELRRVRLERACRLLCETRLSVSRIATEAGFSHSRHFSTIFRRHMGLTPTEYRNTALVGPVDAEDEDPHRVLDAAD